MKKKLLFILIIACTLNAIGAPSEVNKSEVTDIDGTLYYLDETVPFSGVVVDSKDRMYYLNGKPNGKWITFHPNGALKSIENWSNGKLNGKYVIYQPNGKKIMQTTYLNGKDNGEYYLYNENGRLKMKGQIYNGTPYGIWETYDDKGKLIKKDQY